MKLPSKYERARARLRRALRERGYTIAEVDKIMEGNPAVLATLDIMRGGALDLAADHAVPVWMRKPRKRGSI